MLYFHHDESCLFQMFIYYLLKHTPTKLWSELKKPPKHLFTISVVISHDLGGSQKKTVTWRKSSRASGLSKGMVSPHWMRSHAMGRVVSFTYQGSMLEFFEGFFFFIVGKGPGARKKNDTKSKLEAPFFFFRGAGPSLDFLASSLIEQKTYCWWKNSYTTWNV